MLAVSREDELWSLADGRWLPVDPDSSGMRRFIDTLVRRTWPTTLGCGLWGPGALEGARYTPTPGGIPGAEAS